MDVPHFLEATVGVVRLVPQEQVPWIDEQIVELPVPRITEEIVGVVRTCAQLIDQQIVELPLPFWTPTCRIHG